MSAKLIAVAQGLSQLASCLSAKGTEKGNLDLDLVAISTELAALREVVTHRLSDSSEFAMMNSVLEELAAAVDGLRFAKKNVVPFSAAAFLARRADAESLARKAAVLAALAIGSLTAVALPAAAADATTPTYIGMTAQDVGVLDRARPEYDAKGIPLGGFRMFPTMRASANYDSNVLRTNTAAISDWFFEETPAVRIQSQWGRHFFEVYGGLDNYNYADTTRLDLTDWNVGSDGRLDVSRAIQVNAAGSYGKFHEALQSPNTVGFQKSPNRYNHGNAQLSISYQPNRIGIGVGASYDRYNWLNTPLIGPPPGTLFNSDRNESVYQGYVRASYDFSPGYSAFIKGLYEDRSFDHFLDRTGTHRSSVGYHIDAGVDMQISHLVAGEVFLGYLDQKFAPPLRDVTGVDYGVGLEWFASPVFTVHLQASHQVSDSILAGVTATNDQNVRLSADYEFRRNIIFTGFAAYTSSHFVGTTRTDDLPSAGLKMSYLMNRYMSLDTGYTYSKRSSNVAAIEFNDHLVSAGITLHI